MNNISIISRISFNLIKFLFKYNENVLAVIKSFFYYNKKIRISMASILLLEKDNKFILIQNHHRPELYAPIGGVYKYRGNPNLLSEIFWEDDTKYEDKDMKNDLRGLLDGKYFSSFIDWFYTQKDREGSEQCIYREIDEELLEGKAGKTIRNSSREVSIDLFRTVIEGPNEILNNVNYQAQYRYFKIYKPNMNDDATQKIVDELFKRAEKNSNNLILVSKDEIISGRTLNKLAIAAHSKYFFSDRWHGIEPPKY